MSQHRLVAAVLLLVSTSTARADEAAELAKFDETILKANGVGTNGTDVLQFFRKRTPSADDLRTVPRLIRQLGDNDFDAREEATKKLVEFGPPVVALLRPVTKDSDAEVSRRAREAIDAIKGPGPSLPIAAARQAARTRPEGAIAVLVNYLPFADESTVVSEVLNALVALTPKIEQADGVLKGALTDADAGKRAAAGYVLGRAKDEALRARVRKLLADKDATVRFRAAQGLLAGRDKSGVPPLIDIATADHGDLTWQAEDVLIRLADGNPPGIVTGDTDAARKVRNEVWSKWWADNAAKVDLARLTDRPPFFNFTLIPEMHANKVWEIDAQKKVLWQVKIDNCPIDAQVLPGRRILVAELNGGQVSEREIDTGKVVWSHKVNTPIAVARLPNGHTFIGTNSSLHVVTPDNKEVMTYKAEPNFFIHSVQRLANGHMVCVSMEGSVREIDAQGKEVRTVPLPIRGSWSGVEGVPGGNYLAVNNAEGRVIEVDHAGKIVWEYKEQGICYASRLPNGNTLVVNNSKGIIEITRDKQKVWEQPIGTSLWRAHRR